jgi:hypothetical protein
MLAQTATSRNATRHPDFFIRASLPQVTSPSQDNNAAETSSAEKNWPLSACIKSPARENPPPFSRHIAIGKADFLAIATNGCFYDTNGIFCHLNGCFYVFNCMTKEKIKVFIFSFSLLKIR